MMKKYWNNNSGKLWRISQPCFCAFVDVVARILRLFPVWVTSMGNLTQAGADLRWAAVFLSPLADGMFFHLLVVKSCKTNKNLFALMLHAWVISNTTSSFFHTLTTKEFIWFIFPWCIFSSDFKSGNHGNIKIIATKGSELANFVYEMVDLKSQLRSSTTCNR